MNDTPRTDAAVQINDDGCGFVWADFAAELERENARLAAEVARLREALGPFAKVRDTVPLYVMPNLPDCNITATLPADAWQKAKAALTPAQPAAK